MKRFIALVMAVALLMTLTACGNEKAEKYCWSCGEGITNDVSFCPSCGVEQGAIGGITTSTTVETTEQQKTTAKPKVTTTKKPVTTTQKPTTTTPATKPAHTHSYSKKVVAATCTEKGYTIYTCSCGHTYKDNYKNPSHTYSKYLCTQCGIHDKDHTYEFLIEYVKQHGKPFATSISYVLYEDEDENISLTYTAENKYLYISIITGLSDVSVYCSITLDDYFYYCRQTYSLGAQCEVYGYIDAKNYTEGAPLTNAEYKGPPDVQYNVIEVARVSVEYLAETLNNFAEQSGNMQLTMADMGFLSY